MYVLTTKVPDGAFNRLLLDCLMMGSGIEEYTITESRGFCVIEFCNDEDVTIFKLRYAGAESYMGEIGMGRAAAADDEG